jgi:3D (Asp-Asp-Asp) domain-containing protein
MNRRNLILGIAALCALSGCKTTDPRPAPSLGGITARIGAAEDRTKSIEKIADKAYREGLAAKSIEAKFLQEEVQQLKLAHAAAQEEVKSMQLQINELTEERNDFAAKYEAERKFSAKRNKWIVFFILLSPLVYQVAAWAKNGWIQTMWIPGWVAGGAAVILLASIVGLILSFWSLFGLFAAFGLLKVHEPPGPKRGRVFCSSSLVAVLLILAAMTMPASAKSIQTTKGERLRTSWTPDKPPVVKKLVWPKPEKPREMTVRLTVYWSEGAGTDRWTRAGQSATGDPLCQGRSCAVDPRLIPYGSRVEIPSAGLKLTAHDTGSAVVAKTASRGKLPIVDVYFKKRREAEEFARSNQLITKIRIL